MRRADDARPRALVVGSFALGVVLAALFARRTFVGFGNDDADYVLGALSLLQGRLVALNSPSQHAFSYHWPGFSILLAPFAALFSPHWQALKIVPFGLVAASAALALRRFTRRLDAPWASLAAAAFVLNPMTLRSATIVMAEPLLLLLALAAVERLDVKTDDDARESALWALLLGFAALARPEGVILAAACAVALARAPRPRAAAGAVLGPVLALAAWTWAKSAAGGGAPSYWDDALSNLASLNPAPLAYHAASVFATLFAGTVFALPAPHAAWALTAGAVLSGAALAACLVGAAALARRRRGAASNMASASFCAGVLLLHLLWPVVDPRFFWPLLPFALEALAAAAQALSARVAAARPVALAQAALIIVWFALRGADIVSGPIPVSARIPERTFAWARENLPSDAVVQTDIPQAFFLYTGRRAALTDAARAVDSDDFLSHLRGQGFTYVCYREWSAAAGANLPSTDAAVREFAASLKWAAMGGADFRRVFFDAEEGAVIYEVGERRSRRIL